MASILFRAGVPGPTDGLVGSFYIDTNNGNIYGKKTSENAWPFITNIRTFVNDSLVFNPLKTLADWVTPISNYFGTSSWTTLLIILLIIVLIGFFCYRRYYVVY